MSKQTMQEELAIYIKQDLLTVEQSIKWLENFWWTNRQDPVTERDRKQAGWETDRCIMALLNLKNNQA